MQNFKIIIEGSATEIDEFLRRDTREAEECKGALRPAADKILALEVEHKNLKEDLQDRHQEKDRLHRQLEARDREIHEAEQECSRLRDRELAWSREQNKLQATIQTQESTLDLKYREAEEQRLSLNRVTRANTAMMAEICKLKAGVSESPDEFAVYPASLVPGMNHFFKSFLAHLAAPKVFGDLNSLIQTIKLLREVSGLGLKEAKDLVEWVRGEYRPVTPISTESSDR